MLEVFDLMLGPFVACLILTGIHVYLGLHVIERQVIFVDLALAQMAALGATIGFLFGFPLHSTQTYFTSLLLAIFGAAIFALSRSRHETVPQEAIIGIVYAVAAAACILILSQSAGGGEELQALMVGHLLFIGWHEILYIAVVYALVGLIHWKFRRQLLAASQWKSASGITLANLRFWDFVFYLSLGFVVTSSVEVAGVLLVFSYLVVPAVCAVLLSQSIKARLITGWSLGFLTSLVGIIGSYILDLPTGATIVCAFGICLLLTSAAKGLGIRSVRAN